MKLKFNYKQQKDVALDTECEGDLVLQDMGSGLPFRAGSFDGAIRFAFAYLLRSLLEIGHFVS